MIEIQDLAHLQVGRKRARLELGSHDRVKFLAIHLGSKPMTRIAPSSGERSPTTHSMVVVFPAPFGPKMPARYPASLVPGYVAKRSRRGLLVSGFSPAAG